jgi:hypothetical protein
MGKGKWRSGDQDTKTVKVRKGQPQTAETFALSRAKGLSSREFRAMQKSLQSAQAKVRGRNAD